jgi:hypothetical protein
MNLRYKSLIIHLFNHGNNATKEAMPNTITETQCTILGFSQEVMSIFKVLAPSSPLMHHLICSIMRQACLLPEIFVNRMNGKPSSAVCFYFAALSFLWSMVIAYCLFTYIPILHGSDLIDLFAFPCLLFCIWHRFELSDDWVEECSIEYHNIPSMPFYNI